MKVTRSLYVIALCLPAMLVAARKSADIKKNVRDLAVHVYNHTGVDLAEVKATFRFYGENTLDLPYIDGTITIYDLKKNTGIQFKSGDARYHNNNVIQDYFGRKLNYVVLYKLSAARWKVGKMVKVRTARARFKEGIQQTEFVIRIEKNRFGFPMYRIMPKNKVLTAR